MTTNQEGVHLAVRNITGTARSYNEDWHALFDAEGITAGSFNARMLAWINATLSASYTNLNEAMQAFAVEQGFANWASMNTFETFSPASLAPLGWWNPSDITTLWQDSAQTTPVTGDNQPVGYMADLSGNGHHATQTVAANRPIYRTSGGLSWLEFDGVDDFLNTTVPASKLAWCGSVLSTSAAQSGYRMVAGTGPGGSMFVFNLATDNKWGTYGTTNRPTSTDVRTGGPYILTMDGTSSGNFYTNGVVDGTYAETSGNGAPTIGGYGQLAAMRLYGVICRATAWGADRSELETWMGAKAGVSL